MTEFRSIAPEELTLNPFQAIGKDWMLITAADGKGSANPMTASWGGVGILWAKPVAFVFIRPQRYTRELVDSGNGFSINFLEERFRQQLTLCGKQSGRDINKIEACGFEVRREGETPYIAQAHTAFVCRKLYRQPLEAGLFLDPSINEAMYPGNDHHVLYVGEIEKVLVR